MSIHRYTSIVVNRYTKVYQYTFVYFPCEEGEFMHENYLRYIFKGLFR